MNSKVMSATVTLTMILSACSVSTDSRTDQPQSEAEAPTAVVRSTAVVEPTPLVVSTTISKLEALASWADRVGLPYEGDCATVDPDSIAYCSAEQSDGIYALGRVASEFDTLVRFVQDGEGNWVYDFDRPLEPDS